MFRLWAAAFAVVAMAALLAVAGNAFGQEAAIRKALVERLPKLPKIDEVTRSPIPGLWEVRYGGTEIIYSDDKGDFIIANGALIDTKTRTDLTQARIDKLLAVDWDELPLKDAVAIKQGNGSRRVAVFADPNCGFCKRFERDLLAVKDVTIYTFVLPILGPDSTAKSRDIVCAKDPGAAWRAWMIDGVVPPKAGRCDAAVLERTRAFADKHRINGTPAVFFVDGTRQPGALSAETVERLLTAAAAKK